MEKLLTNIYKNRRLTAVLAILTQVISLAFVAVFGIELGIFIYRAEYTSALLFALFAAVGYILVSLMRRLIDAPRPYELYTFYEIKPKERQGQSFPSRHAYSAVCLSVLFFEISIPIALMLILVSLVMCAFRVLLGIHFIRDVLCGALIGAVAGTVGLLLI